MDLPDLEDRDLVVARVVGGGVPGQVAAQRHAPAQRAGRGQGRAETHCAALQNIFLNLKF